MQKAVIYIRVSTEKQATEGYSLDSQVERCTSYAKNRNFQIENIYRDEGISGTDPNRPGLNKALTRIKEGDIDAIIAYDFSRLSRNSTLSLQILDMFELTSTKFHTVI